MHGEVGDIRTYYKDDTLHINVYWEGEWREVVYEDKPELYCDKDNTLLVRNGNIYTCLVCECIIRLNE